MYATLFWYTLLPRAARAGGPDSPPGPAARASPAPLTPTSHTLVTRRRHGSGSRTRYHVQVFITANGGAHAQPERNTTRVNTETAA